MTTLNAMMPVVWVSFVNAEARYESEDCGPEQLCIISLEVSPGQNSDLALSLIDTVSMTSDLLAVLEQHDILTPRETERIQCLIRKRSNHLRQEPGE